MKNPRTQQRLLQVLQAAVPDNQIGDTTPLWHTLLGHLAPMNKENDYTNQLNDFISRFIDGSSSAADFVTSLEEYADTLTHLHDNSYGTTVQKANIRDCLAATSTILSGIMTGRNK